MDRLIDKGIIEILTELTGREVIKWILIILCVKIIIFFLKRMIICWYYKIDDRLTWLKISQQTQQEIFEALDLQLEHMEKLEKRQEEQIEKLNKLIEIWSEKKTYDS